MEVLTEFKNILETVDILDRIQIQNHLHNFSAALPTEESIETLRQHLRKALLEEILKTDNSPKYHTIMQC